MNLWGKHLLLDCTSGNENIKSKEKVREFFLQLVKEINMVAYGECWVERFATHDETKAGLSAFQMIETSNLSGHFCDNTGSFFIDCFSCMEFDPEIVKNLINEYFRPSKIKETLIYRYG